jgi:hypothetical protein
MWMSARRFNILMVRKSGRGCDFSEMHIYLHVPTQQPRMPLLGAELYLLENQAQRRWFEVVKNGQLHLDRNCHDVIMGPAWQTLGV